MTLLLDIKSGLLKYCLFEDGKCTERKFTYDPIEARHKFRVINKTKKIDTVGYRFAHGGDVISEAAMLINVDTLLKIKKANKFCPERNTIIYNEIKNCMQILPDAQHILLCDSAFYINLPEHVRTYALPYEFAKRGIRRYGRQGLTHQWAYEKAKKLSSRQMHNVISIFLDDYTNIVAIKDGMPLDVSDGFAGEGSLVSKTYCGGIDLSVIFQMLSRGESVEKINSLLAKKSGFKAMAGGKCGLKDIFRRKDPKANMAKEVYFYNILKHVGAYIAALGGLDAVIFVGEKKKELIDLSLEIISELSFMGLKEKTSAVSLKNCLLTSKKSKIDSYYFEFNKWNIMAEFI